MRKEKHLFQSLILPMFIALKALLDLISLQALNPDVYALISLLNRKQPPRN